jgi:hypothetical protein
VQQENAGFFLSAFVQEEKLCNTLLQDFFPHQVSMLFNLPAADAALDTAIAPLEVGHSACREGTADDSAAGNIAAHLFDLGGSFRLTYDGTNRGMKTELHFAKEKGATMVKKFLSDGEGTPIRYFQVRQL